MTVFVLNYLSETDSDGLVSDCIGVFKTQEKAHSKMLKEYTNKRQQITDTIDTDYITETEAYIQVGRGSNNLWMWEISEQTVI